MKLQRSRRRRPAATERGQAMTEALLLMLPLMMIVAALLQVFLVDEHTFRLATRAYQQLFQAEAFRRNQPGVRYDTATVYWDGPERYVPVVGFFAPYGLTSEDLRIRSVRDERDKPMMIGRGTAPSIVDGLAGTDASSLLGAVDRAMNDMARAQQIRRTLEEQRARAR